MLFFSLTKQTEHSIFPHEKNNFRKNLTFDSVCDILPMLIENVQ